MKKTVNASNYPVVEMKGCLLEDLFYGKANVDDHSTRETRAQLKSGGVQTLIAPVFTNNGGPEDIVRQSEILRDLPRKYPDDFHAIKSAADLTARDTIGLYGAIENFGSLFDKAETLEEAATTLNTIEKSYGQVLYVSLTWKNENALGGGDATTVGLKDKGKAVLAFLSERNATARCKIAIDISHASDALANDILSYIDSDKLDLKVIASHSSLRTIKQIPRNLPDWAAREIIKRDGFIGINFITGYVGTQAFHLLDHFDYVVNALGGENHVGFGADWFKTDRPDLKTAVTEAGASFFERYSDASKYQVLLADLRREGFSEAQLEKIASQNALRFVKSQWVL